MMTVAMGLGAAHFSAGCLVALACHAECVGVATPGQVQLAYQAQREQQIQRAVDGDQPQRRVVGAAESQQFGAAGLSACLIDRHQHGPARPCVRVTGLRQGIQQWGGGRRRFGYSLDCTGRKSKLTFIFHPLILAASVAKVKSEVFGDKRCRRVERKVRNFKLCLLTRPAVHGI
jgi:hypothetical protein